MSEPMPDFRLDPEEDVAPEEPTRRNGSLRTRSLRDPTEGAPTPEPTVRARLHEKRLAARRALFELRATLRSSAALAGLSRDAHQVGHNMREDVHRAGEKVRERLPKDSATAAGARKDLFLLRGAITWHLRQAGRRVRQAGKRAKARAMRSAFLSGLAIDSHRVAKRLRSARRHNGPRIAH